MSGNRKSVLCSYVCLHFREQPSVCWRYNNCSVNVQPGQRVSLNQDVVSMWSFKNLKQAFCKLLVSLGVHSHRICISGPT